MVTQNAGDGTIITQPMYIKTEYEITLDADFGCNNGTNPWITFNGISGNLVGFVDSIGISILIVGVTISDRLEHSTYDEALNCPAGYNGSILKKTINFKVIERWSIGLNPGIGPWSIDIGLSWGQDIERYSGSLVIEANCCCKQ